MIDYIKRSDAIKAVYEEWDEWINYDGSGREIASDTEDALCRLDAEDVAPVRHGRWYQDAIYYGEDGSPCIVDICTECGAYGYYADFNYCPNCGAKMDEGGSNGTDD